MAEQLQTIQRRIKSIESTEKITNAMQLVAAAKLKQATNRFDFTRDNLSELVAQFRAEIQSRDLPPAAFPKTVGSPDNPNHTGSPDNPNHAGSPESHETPVAPADLVIIVTGSKGMCGSYNSSIIKELDNISPAPYLLPLGSKGYDHIRTNHLNLLDGPWDHETLSMPPEEHPYDTILSVAKALIQKQQDGEIKDIYILFAEYKNTITYEVKTKLIFNAYNLEEHQDIIPYIEELLSLEIYSAISEAALNEYGARRLAMKNASDNAEAMLKDLEMMYHRARQEDITNELIEIISGTESQSKK